MQAPRTEPQGRKPTAWLPAAERKVWKTDAELEERDREAYRFTTQMRVVSAFMRAKYMDKPCAVGSDLDEQGKDCFAVDVAEEDMAAVRELLHQLEPLLDYKVNVHKYVKKSGGSQLRRART
jgi:RNA processing factor Prp31